MSLTLVILNAKYAHTIKNAEGDEQTRTPARFFQSETLTFNSCHSLDHAGGNDSIIYFTDLCKPIETYIYAKESTHLQVIPQQSTQTQQTCGYRHTTKPSRLFLTTPHGRQLQLSQKFSKFRFLCRSFRSC